MDRFENQGPGHAWFVLSFLQRLALVGLILVVAGRAACAEVTGRLSATVNEALDELVAVDCADVPFDRALTQIKRRQAVPIRMDTKSLTENWLAANEPVTLRTPRITLRSALTLMTQAANPNLDWTIQGGAILVTSKQKAEEDAVVRHEVFDLVVTKPNSTRKKDSDLDYDALASVTTDVIEPQKWPDGTGPSIISLGQDHGTVIFPLEPRVHDECEDLFIALRQVIHTQAEQLRVGPPAKVENEDRLRKALEEKMAVNVVQVPLAQVLAMLAKRHSVPIVVDPFALNERQATRAAMAAPVSLRMADITLRSALASLLKPLELVAFVQNEVVFVTQPEKLPLEVVVYWIGDLVSGKEKDGAALMARIEAAAKKGRPDVNSGACRWFRGNRLLVCLETADAQERIFSLLTAMRSKQKSGRP